MNKKMNTTQMLFPESKSNNKMGEKRGQNTAGRRLWQDLWGECLPEEAVGQ